MATDAGTLRSATQARAGILRAARGRRRLRCRTPAFVRGVLGRGAAGAAIARPVDMALRAIGRPVVTQITNVDSRLDLRIAFTTRLMPAVRSRTRVEPMVPWTPATPAGDAHQPASPDAGPAIVERITERTRRVEVPARALPEPSSMGPTGPARIAGLLARPSSAMPQGLTVRRTVVVLPAPRGEGAEDRPLPPPRTDRVSPGAVHRSVDVSRLAIPLSPSELGRLTDDVVRVLNNRVVAHRERQGVI